MLGWFNVGGSWVGRLIGRCCVDKRAVRGGTVWEIFEVMSGKILECNVTLVEVE